MKGRQYTKQEIRLVRIFLLIFLFMGVYNLIWAFMVPSRQESASQTVSSETTADELATKGNTLKSGKLVHKKRSPAIIARFRFILAGVFFSLFAAGNLAIWKVLKNNLRDVEFDPVEEASENAS